MTDMTNPPTPAQPANPAAPMTDAAKQRTLTFYGCSDDLFECDDSAGRATDEVGCYGSIGAYRLTLERGDETIGLLVVGHYDTPGTPKGMPPCWTVGICPLDEDVPLPSWPCHVTAERHSTRLTIAVPADVACVPVKDHAHD